jgi:hypothetical protein
MAGHHFTDDLLRVRAAAPVGVHARDVYGLRT